MYKGYRSPARVALTFDDGPDPDWTPLVLDALAAAGASATFFVIAPRAVLGEPGELLREPYFSRDAIRTAVTWAGISGTALEAALDVLASKGEPDDVVSLAAGRMLAARGTIDSWLAYAAEKADEDPSSLPAISTELRESVALSCRLILDEAARAVGSRPFAVSGPLDRARRDLGLLLPQHRLEPALVRRGRQAISDRRS